MHKILPHSKQEPCSLANTALETGEADRLLKRNFDVDPVWERKNNRTLLWTWRRQDTPPPNILSQVRTNYLRCDSGWKIIELNSASLTFLVWYNMAATLSVTRRHGLREERNTAHLQPCSGRVSFAFLHFHLLGAANMAQVNLAPLRALWKSNFSTVPWRCLQLLLWGRPVISLLQIGLSVNCVKQRTQWPWHFQHDRGRGRST